MAMATTEIETAIISAARRREVSADIEAGLHNISVGDARRILRRLHRQGRVYQSTKSAAQFWGATFAGYRAV